MSTEHVRLVQRFHGEDAVVLAAVKAAGVEARLVRGAVLAGILEEGLERNLRALDRLLRAAQARSVGVSWG